jgi:hypothetical protein
MPQLPGPVRAALGVISMVVDDRHSLPDRALELPVLAVSTALQMSLRAQQRYAALTAKGDEFLSQLRGVPEDPPEWARFDDDETANFAPENFATEKAAPEKVAAQTSADDPADEPAADSVPTDTVAARRSESNGKPIKAPRKGRPSAFDRADDTKTHDTKTHDTKTHDTKTTKKKVAEKPVEPDAPIDVPDLEGFSIPHPPKS